MDTHTRSVLKTITWRALATLTTIVLVFIFTRNFAISLGVGGIELVAKLVLYYLHERAWNLSDFGRLYKKKN